MARVIIKEDGQEQIDPSILIKPGLQDFCHEILISSWQETNPVGDYRNSFWLLFPVECMS